MEKVLKPFDIFFEIKFKSSNNNENESSLLEQARAAWSNLSAKKQTKFILKSQETFDSKEQNTPLYFYLTRRELELLFKAYGMPEKLPQNSRLYYIEKESVANNLHLLQDARNSASEKWKTLSKEVKTAINNEFHQLQDKHIDEFFMFARNLPEARIPDYKHFLSISKKPETQTESENFLSSKKNASKRIKENPFKAFTPFEIFIDKHRNHEIEEFVKLRSMYVSLPDNKKIKYIKKAEKRYDSSDLKDKPLFTSFLSKNEVQLLFESYGIPEIIPNQLSAYYMKKIFKTGIKDMKQVFNQFRKLNAQEKADLIDEHIQQLKEYTQKNQAFIDQLPSTRIEDYRQLKTRNTKSIKNADELGNVSKKFRS